MPLLYELNTRCWLGELTQTLGRKVTLESVPDEQFAGWQRFGFTHVWLMGVWPTGPRARAEALADPSLLRAYDEALPGWRPEDVAGSPYAIAQYHVAPALGEDAALRKFRRKLNGRGLKLVLDFVPNHLGLDHPWVREHPDYFVGGSDAAQKAGDPTFFAQQTPAGVRWLAHGKDPYFPAWTDTAQLDYRNTAARDALKRELCSIAERCDGVRCDMAMLVLNEIFERTWGPLTRATESPLPEFWPEAISAVKMANPDFVFMAEAYWGLETVLQRLGFDYTYDKQLYDEIVHRNPEAVRRGFQGGSDEFISKSVHFLENHDEPRIANLLNLDEQKAALLVTLGLLGMTLLHEGQLTGARTRAPVQLARRRIEAPQPDIARMYEDLLLTTHQTAIGRGDGHVLNPREAAPGNASARNFVLVQWQTPLPEFDLVVANLAPHRSQCFAPLSARGLAGCDWALKDLLGIEEYARSGAELARQGLYLDVPPNAAQLFHFEPVS